MKKKTFEECANAVSKKLRFSAAAANMEAANHARNHGHDEAELKKRAKEIAREHA